jgi:hypothetical protein
VAAQRRVSVFLSLTHILMAAPNLISPFIRPYLVSFDFYSSQQLFCEITFSAYDREGRCEGTGGRDIRA